MNKDELKAFVTGMATGGELAVNGVFGGEEMMEQTVLWEGVQKPASRPTNITLSDGINNYDALIVSAWTYYNSEASYDECNNIVIPSCDYMLRSGSDAINRTFAIATYYDYRYRVVQFGFLDNTTLVLDGAVLNTQSALRKVIGLKFTSRINYSTEEQCVGTWVDGKPLYQKTVYIPSGPTGSFRKVTYHTGIHGADTAFIEGGFIGDFPLNLPGENNSTEIGTWLDRQGTEIIIAMLSVSDRTNISGYVILRYTKA